MLHGRGDRRVREGHAGWTKVYPDIEGIDPGKLGAHLMDKHGILVTSIGHKDFQGLRVTPNIYATLDEIETFGEVMQPVAAKGLS